MSQSQPFQRFPLPPPPSSALRPPPSALSSFEPIVRYRRLTNPPKDFASHYGWAGTVWGRGGVRDGDHRDGELRLWVRFGWGGDLIVFNQRETVRTGRIAIPHRPRPSGWPTPHCRTVPRNPSSRQPRSRGSSKPCNARDGPDRTEPTSPRWARRGSCPGKPAAWRWPDAFEKAFCVANKGRNRRVLDPDLVRLVPGIGVGHTIGAKLAGQDHRTVNPVLASPGPKCLF